MNLRMACVIIGLLAPAGFTIGDPSALGRLPSSPVRARVTGLNGVARTVEIEGAGCSASICSRTVIKGKDELGAGIAVRFDAIAAIRNITGSDALFLMRDGAQRRISLVTDFRVLYFATPSGATEKLDLAKIQSIEFLEPSGNRQGSF